MRIRFMLLDVIDLRDNSVSTLNIILYYVISNLFADKGVKHIHVNQYILD